MKEITLEELLDRILLAEGNELNSIIDAITERFAEVWPDWELATLSIHGHTKDDLVAAFQQSLSLITKNNLP